MPGAGGEFLGNMLMNLLAPVSSAPQFTGGYQPGQPGNPQTPQDFTNYSGPRIDPGSPQMADKAASYQPLQPNPDLVNTFAARLRGLGPQLAAQAALYNQQFGNQQMQAQNQWANSQGVNPTDPNLGTLNGSALARALSQAQAGTLQAQSGSLQSILSGLTTAGAIPYANNIGSSGALNTISGNVAQGLESQNRGIAAQTLQPSAASSALIRNQAEDTTNQSVFQNALNSILRAQGAKSLAYTSGYQGAKTDLRQQQAAQAQAGLGTTTANQTQSAYEQNPSLISQGLQQEPQLRQAQIDAANRTKGFPGAPTEIYGPGNQYQGSVTVPPLRFDPNTPLGQTMNQFNKVPGSPEYSPAPRTIPNPYLNQHNPISDIDSIHGIPPQMYSVPNVGQSQGVGGGQVAPSIPAQEAQQPIQDLMDQFKKMTPAQRQRLVEQIQASKSDGVAPANSLLFNPGNSYMFQPKNKE